MDEISRTFRSIEEFLVATRRIPRRRGPLRTRWRRKAKNAWFWRFSFWSWFFYSGFTGSKTFKQCEKQHQTVKRFFNNHDQVHGKMLVASGGVFSLADVVCDSSQSSLFQLTFLRFLYKQKHYSTRISFTYRSRKNFRKVIFIFVLARSVRAEEPTTIIIFGTRQLLQQHKHIPFSSRGCCTWCGNGFGPFIQSSHCSILK